MIRSFLIFTAMITTLFMTRISSADTKAYCAGTGNNTRVAISINIYNEGVGSYKLAVTAANQETVYSAGTAQVGGGDGMLWASLKGASGNGSPVDQGRLTWWVVPTITPRITLAGQSKPILLNCQNLWPQQQ